MFFVLLSYFLLSCPALADSKLSDSKNLAHPSLFFQNSSKKAYLLYQAKQREFKQRQALALKERETQLKSLQKQKKLKDKVEELEFQSHIHPEKIPSLSQKLSKKEEAFWEYQNQLRLMEVSRKRAFHNYKKQYKNYQKRKRSALQTRLKKTQLLRKKFKPINQAVESSSFENL